jgi:hypothetical protein
MFEMMPHDSLKFQILFWELADLRHEVCEPPPTNLENELDFVNMHRSSGRSLPFYFKQHAKKKKKGCNFFLIFEYK